MLDSTLDAGRLLTLALDVAASPGAGADGAEYTRLLRRYIDDAPFRALFDGVVEGTGCEVCAADATVGIVLRTRRDGPWAWPARGTDLPWNNSFEPPERRGARALVVIALLAFIAPSAADLDDLLSDSDVVVTAVSVRELEEFIRDFCEQRESTAAHPDSDERAKPLWWYWLQLPPDAPTSTRIARSTTTYIVANTLSFLQQEGWLVDTTPKGANADKRYRPRRRLIHHYRDLLLDEVFAALRLHAQGIALHGTATESATTVEVGDPGEDVD